MRNQLYKKLLWKIIQIWNHTLLSSLLLLILFMYLDFKKSLRTVISLADNVCKFIYVQSSIIFTEDGFGLSSTEIGGIIGGLLFLIVAVLLAVIAVMCSRRRDRRKNTKYGNTVCNAFVMFWWVIFYLLHDKWEKA